MTDLSSPSSDGDALRADVGDPNRDRADIAEEPPVQIDEDAIRERVEQDDDDDTDSVI
jgi:hypothetical protein